MSSGMIQLFVILYMAFGVVIEELCPSPLLFLCVVPFGMYLDNDEDISIFGGTCIMFYFVNRNLMVLYSLRCFSN